MIKVTPLTLKLKGKSQRYFRCNDIINDDNNDTLKSLPSNRDELMLLDLTLVPADTKSKHFTDGEQCFSVKQCAPTNNEEMLHHYREWYSINFISDNYDKKSTDGYGLLERIAVSKMWIGSFDAAFKRKS